MALSLMAHCFSEFMLMIFQIASLTNAERDMFAVDTQIASASNDIN